MIFTWKPFERCAVYENTLKSLPELGFQLNALTLEQFPQVMGRLHKDVKLRNFRTFKCLVPYVFSNGK